MIPIRKVNYGTVVQIKPETNQMFGGCFLVVTKQLQTGVEGYIYVPQSNGSQPGITIQFIANGDFYIIGESCWQIDKDFLEQTIAKHNEVNKNAKKK